MKNARQIAFEILNKIQRDNSYSNLILDSVLDNCELSQIDKSLASVLVYGVVERKITLDYELSNYLSQPLKKLKPQVLTVLRLGAYQLLFMDKIPASAAINESVKLAKNNGATFASGLVNAVLRKISSNGVTPTDNLSVRYSVPDRLCDLWIDSYGKENAVRLLESTFGNTETTVRANSLRTDADNLISIFREENISAQFSDLDGALTVNHHGPVHKTTAYSDGLFHVQDLASQYCCKALNAEENDIVLDICSAPGGKSFTVAQYMNNTGLLYSFDIYDHRLKLINDGAKRLGITNIVTKINDGTVFDSDIPLADKILCDVPCAGLGVIRKKPEIRYKDLDEVDKLPDLQYSILCVSSKYLKIGGTLIYSTCSLNPDENERVVERFLAEHKDFESVRVLDDLKRYGEDTDYITLMPHIHNCDGFFIAGLKRIKDV